MRGGFIGIGNPPTVRHRYGIAMCRRYVAGIENVFTLDFECDRMWLVVEPFDVRNCESCPENKSTGGEGKPRKVAIDMVLARQKFERMSAVWRCRAESEQRATIRRNIQDNGSTLEPCGTVKEDPEPNVVPGSR